MPVTLHLSNVQLVDALRRRGVEEGEPGGPGGSGHGSGHGSASGTTDVVYLLAVEGDAPAKNWSWAERMLDQLVQFMQPTPVMTHVELMIPPTHDDAHVNFASYLGQTAGWQSVASAAGERFYMVDNADSWRAVPVFAVDAARRVVHEAAAHVGTPYSLPRYAFAVPPLRNLACALPDAAQAPGHCATVAARVLRNAVPEVRLRRASGYYGPSTLFIELNDRARMDDFARRLDEHAAQQTSERAEASKRALDVLLRHSDDAVRALSDEECAAGVELLTARACRTSASGDVIVARIAQKQLARGLLRWAVLRR